MEIMDKFQEMLEIAEDKEIPKDNLVAFLTTETRNEINRHYLTDGLIDLPTEEMDTLYGVKVFSTKKIMGFDRPRMILVNEMGIKDNFKNLTTREFIDFIIKAAKENRVVAIRK